MKAMLAVLLISFLAGCGSGGEEGNNNHGYGFQYDSIGASGMKLRGGPDPSYLESLFAETETCTGLNAPAPFVIIVAPGSLNEANENINGEYWDSPPLVLLDFSQGLAAKHEFVHYLMDVVQHVQDSNHTSPLFAKCS